MHSSPNINIVQAQDYRDGYANSVQVRASVWDFMLIFGAARILPTKSFCEIFRESI